MKSPRTHLLAGCVAVGLAAACAGASSGDADNATATTSSGGTSTGTSVGTSSVGSAVSSSAGASSSTGAPPSSAVSGPLGPSSSSADSSAAAASSGGATSAAASTGASSSVSTGTSASSVSAASSLAASSSAASVSTGSSSGGGASSADSGASSGNVAPGFAADLMFSEYVEGTSNNKAFELVNNTGATRSLSGYSAQLFTNGAGTASNTLALSGTLAQGQTLALCSGSASQALKDRCAQSAAAAGMAQSTAAVAAFNGDDTLVLLNAGQPVDRFGDGTDPGTQWGSSVASVDQTLRRRCDITQGTLPAPPFDPAAQWLALPTDDFSNVGSWHCTTPTPGSSSSSSALSVGASSSAAVASSAVGGGSSSGAAASSSGAGASSASSGPNPCVQPGLEVIACGRPRVGKIAVNATHVFWVESWSVRVARHDGSEATNTYSSLVQERAPLYIDGATGAFTTPGTPRTVGNVVLNRPTFIATLAGALWVTDEADSGRLLRNGVNLFVDQSGPTAGGAFTADATHFYRAGAGFGGLSRWEYQGGQAANPLFLDFPGYFTSTSYRMALDDTYLYVALGARVNPYRTGIVRKRKDNVGPPELLMETTSYGPVVADSTRLYFLNLNEGTVESILKTGEAGSRVVLASGQVGLEDIGLSDTHVFWTARGPDVQVGSVSNVVRAPKP